MTPLPQGPDVSDLQSATSFFLSVRSKLFGVAYRMVGTVAEAEDVLQDTWLRWQTYDRTQVLQPTGFLVSVTTRIAMNRLTSATSRREVYVGPWLPEPVDTSADPTLGAERNEALSMAVLLLLEKLTPAERAAYILREAFDYSHLQIAEVLDVSEANARQIFARARKHITSKHRAAFPKSERDSLLRALVAAAQEGEVAGLEKLLSKAVVSTSDGGGAVRAALVPVRGGNKVSRFIASFASHWWTDVVVRWVEVNGEPAAVLSRQGAPHALISIHAEGGRIEQIYWVMNPAKLGRLMADPG